MQDTDFISGICVELFCLWNELDIVLSSRTFFYIKNNLIGCLLLKILHASLQHYANQELPDVQTGFRKGRGTRDQIAKIRWIIEKQGNSRKTSASKTTLEPLTVYIITNCGKLLKRWEYQTILPIS